MSKVGLCKVGLLSASRLVLTIGIPSNDETAAQLKKHKIFSEFNMIYRFSDHDVIIYNSGKCPHQLLGRQGEILKQAPSYAVEYENGLRSALENGKIVCIVGFDANDYVVSGILESYGMEFDEIEGDKIFSGIKIIRSEFKPFLDDIRATTVAFDKDDTTDAICILEDYASMVGFSKRADRGLLLFIPCSLNSVNPDSVAYYLKKLIDGIIAYSSKRLTEPPSWLKEFQFTDEKNIRQELDHVNKDIVTPLIDKLKFHEMMKNILWLGDNKLRDAVSQFLKNIGFITEIDDIGEEDFWIILRKERKVMVEAKGKNKNLTREDISLLDTHREAREVPSVTALLVANTFMTANSIKEKDQPFPPNVIEKAVNTKVVVTRTLDLCQIYDYLGRSETNIADKLLRIIDGQKGWLTFRDNKIQIVP